MNHTSPNELFFLCDLTHTGQTINSDVVPYPIGCIKSHLLANSDSDVQIELFKYPARLSEEFLRQRPSLVGFSNYSWNSDLSLTFAKAIKRVAPDVLVVFGGPNYPLERHRQEQWLREHPEVDIYVLGEGEEPFLGIAETWLQGHSIDTTKRTNVYGIHSYVDQTLRSTTRYRNDGTEDLPRVRVLDDTPSPYLAGYLDEFVTDSRLVPLMESTRGCPFTCTFCRDGISSLSKISRAGLERLEAELVYIAERYTGTNLVIADDNFGMYKENLAFSRAIASVKKQYNYPLYLEVSTGKNQKARVIECANILEGSLRFTGSVQSLDEEVLRNVKRSNISYEQLIEVSSRVSNTDANTYSEIILGLPSDSKAKHIQGVCRLIDAGFNQVRTHTLMILNGSVLATDEQREKFHLRTRFRVLPRSFGLYGLGDEALPSAEIEEVSVEQDTMPFEDYVECRRFALTVTLFYNDKIFFEVAQFIKLMGFRVSDWVRYVHERVCDYSVTLSAIYDQFTADTIGELHPSREQLDAHIKQGSGTIHRYLEGELGNNLLMNAQVKAQVEQLDATHDVAYRCAREFIGLAAERDDHHIGYLENLRKYSLLKKGNVLDLSTEIVEQFDFDLPALETSFFSALPSEKRPTKVRFYYDEARRDYLADQFRRHGTSNQALGKIFNRLAIKKTHRSVASVDDLVGAGAR